MPAFSLYITDDRLAFLKAESARLGISQAKLVSLLVDQYRKKNRPQLACVGADRVSWTGALPLEEAVKTHAQALAAHPNLVIYLLPTDAPHPSSGSAVPPDWTEHAPGL